MEMFEFASVTYCTNVPRGEFLSDEEAEFVATQVSEALQSKLRESTFAEDIGVVRIEFGRGCIMTTLTLGATVAGLYKFVKDYPKFRPGLLLLLKDLNGIYVWLKGNERKGSTYLARDDLPELKELEVIAEQSKTGTRKLVKASGRAVRKADGVNK